MTTPATIASCALSLANIVKAMDADLQEAVGTYLPQENVILQGNQTLDGAFAGPAQQAVTNWHATHAALVAQGGDTILGQLQQMGTIFGFSNDVVGSTPALLAFLRRAFIDNPTSLSPPVRFHSRQFVNGTPAAGGASAGNAKAYRLLVDEDGYNLEQRFADTVNARCTTDAQGGANPGQETWKVYGQTFRDLLDYESSTKGSGKSVFVTAISADDTLDLLLNPSFSDYAGTPPGSPGLATTTQLYNWNVTAGTIGTNLKVDTQNLHVVAKCETVPASLAFLGSATISQTLSTNNKFIPPGAPTFFEMWCEANPTGGAGGAVGTLTITIGTKVLTQAVSGQTGWFAVRFPLDKTCYLRNYNASGIGVQIAWMDGGSGNQFNVDDIRWRAFDVFDNGYLVIDGGSTRSLVGDTFSWADTEPNSPAPVSSPSAKIIRSLWRFFDPIASINDLSMTPTGPTFSFPAVPPAPAIGAFAAADGGGGGNLSAGVYTFWLSQVDAQGVESPLSASITSPSLASGHKANLSGIPATSSTAVKYGVYGSKAGATTPFFLAYVTTTTYTDNTADTSLPNAGAIWNSGGVPAIYQDDT